VLHKTLLTIIFFLSVNTLNLLLIVSASHAGTTKYTYDESNRLSVITFENGSQINCLYDEAGNLLSKKLSAAKAVAEVNITSVLPASPSSIGLNIFFNALATGGSGTPQYQFLIQNPSTGSWTSSEYGTSSFAWTTAGLPTGTYNIQVRARNIGSTAAYEAYTTMSYTLSSTPAVPVSSVSITSVVPASPLRAGSASSVTFNVLATGGSGVPQYQLRVQDPATGTWASSAYGAGPLVWVLTGLSAGVYNIEVRARNAGSTAGYEAHTTTTYELLEWMHHM